MEAIIALAELGVTSKNIISLIPQVYDATESFSCFSLHRLCKFLDLVSIVTSIHMNSLTEKSDSASGPMHTCPSNYILLCYNHYPSSHLYLDCKTIRSALLCEQTDRSLRN